MKSGPIFLGRRAEEGSGPPLFLGWEPGGEFRLYFKEPCPSLPMTHEISNVRLRRILEIILVLFSCCYDESTTCALVVLCSPSSVLVRKKKKTLDGNRGHVS